MKRDYRISIDRDDLITPEETLLDSGSDLSDLERPISDLAFRIIWISFILLIGVILSFSFKISIVDHKSLSIVANQNRSANFQIPPPRGIILDRSGKPLTKNLPSFDLLVISKEIREHKEDYDVNLGKIAKALGLDRDILASQVADQMKSSSIFFIAKDLSKEQLLEINFLNPQGFYVIADTKRYYVDGSQFSQIIGYTGKVSKDDLARDSYYLSTDTIGRAGLEDEYEEYLRGEHGRVFFSGGASGDQKEALPGNNIVLNIDYDMQKVLYNSLFNILKPTSLDKAAAIVQNPQNGEVLALVSFPSFDNNLFRDGLSETEYKKLFDNSSKPLFNRVVSGVYNPGSTIKPFMGMAILQEGIFKISDTIKDCVSLTVPDSSGGDTGRTFKNWRVDLGQFNLRRAIADSCNIYFFIGGGGYGKISGLGVDRIANYLKNALADVVLGIDLPNEGKGFVPTPAWKETERGESWYPGDTYNISIGQGDLSVTPLWLNSYIAAIANGGTIYRPRIANRIVDGKNNTLKIFKTEVLKKLPFREDIIDEMRRDMEETVISGTAKLLQDIPVRVGAKTGTSEIVKGKRINSLFTAFAPLNNAEIVVTVLTEGSSSNEGYATRTVNEFMKWYFSKDNVLDVVPSISPAESPEPSISPAL